MKKLVCALTLSAVAACVRADDSKELKFVIKDEHAQGTDLWVYNDIAKAKDLARKQNKPLFVTFRCVPCRACAGFDAEVAKGSKRIEKLAREKFIAVRQVEMKGVDLSQFEFDYDLNWAAMFINADGTVYARYGTQSAQGPDAYNSIDGLENTMKRVLQLHASYPDNADKLKGKRRTVTHQSALDMPGLLNKETRVGATTRQNCIHCHMLHDAQNHEAQASGNMNHDMLWRYPLPDNVGLTIDPKSGVHIEKVEPGSPAARAGLKAGEELKTANGQALTSIADLQWVLHDLPNEDVSLEIEGSASGKRTLSLSKGWKQTDISWRGSLWSVSPVLRVWMPPLDPGQRRRHKLPGDQQAFLVKWINRSKPGGKAALQSGLREGDVVVELDGKPIKHQKTNQFMTYVKLNYDAGQELPLTIIRDGKRKQLQIKLVE